MGEQQTQMQKLTPKQKKAAAKKRRRKNSISAVLAVLIVFLAFYLALSLLIAGLILYSFYNTSENDDIYSISVLYDETEIYELDSDEANNEYGLYVPFEYLAEIGSFGLAGEGDNVTLFLIGTDNRIKCTKNSSLVEINDNPIRISAPILYEEDDYLIPVSLIENYIKGIDVTYDNEEMICKISSDLSKADVSLKLLLPDDMEAAYFPESYKYYNYGEESGDESGDISDDTQTDENTDE